MKVLRWVSDEPQPGWVEAEFVDAYGTGWRFFDKPPIFESEGVSIRQDSVYPMAITMPVTVLEIRTEDARSVASVALPYCIGCESGQDRFDVLSEDLLHDV